MIKIKGLASTLQKLKKDVNTEKELKSSIALENLKNKLIEATPIDTGEARSGWKVIDGKIINDVAHISELNHGSSSQAPARFIEAVVIADKNFEVSGIIVTDKE